MLWDEKQARSSAPPGQLVFAANGVVLAALVVFSRASLRN
jgi:hypothetical protein